MNYLTLMKKQFKFLCGYGYVQKNLSENADNILQFVGKFHITVWRVLQLMEDYDVQKTVEENLSKSFYKLIVSVNNIDIFRCNLFDSCDLADLDGEIKTCHTDEEKIIKYAAFVKKNINLLT